METLLSSGCRNISVLACASLRARSARRRSTMAALSERGKEATGEGSPVPVCLVLSADRRTRSLVSSTITALGGEPALVESVAEADSLLGRLEVQAAVLDLGAPGAPELCRRMKAAGGPPALFVREGILPAEVLVRVYEAG